MTATIPAVEDLYPLSPTQQGLLFHSLYGPDSGVYVVQMGFTMRGTLNLETFCQAWQGLVQRHSVLRTAFTWESLAEPLQVVGRQATLPISIQDWQTKSPPDQAQALTAWLECDRRQGFDLSAAPLMRLTILQLAPDRYRVIWTYHHLLLDGWSVPLLLRELLVSYQALERGQTPALSTPRPYRNYIAWLKQQDMAAAKQFWQHRLQGLSAPTPLGIDRPRQRTAASPAQYTVQRRCLSPELTDALRSHAQTHRLTLNTLVQGAWALVLGRYSGEPEVLFGNICAGRPTTLPGAETIIGLFINTLPLRVSLAPDQPIHAWLQQLQDQQLEQQPYEYTPLVQIHGSSDIPRSWPLFESVVVFENYPVEPALKRGVHDLAIEDVSTAEQTNYPLTLFAIADRALELKVQYDCDRFTATAIERLLGHLETVLAGFVAHPQSALGQIPLLTPTEQQQLITWNQTEQPIPDRCVHELIADQATVNPNATALIFEDTVLSYQELDQRANQLAYYLMQQGVQRGDRVALCLERSA
ncbi:MAG: condensation domain-containing protein, partial [Cyanobacteria bacterium P01_E01_bin.43]